MRPLKKTPSRLLKNTRLPCCALVRYRIAGVDNQAEICIIGGGLAGCEAAWQAARRGCRVRLYEMKPGRYSPAHRQPCLAELVCSNSLRSNSLANAAGVLKQEMRLCGSLVMRYADASAVPAGSALAVDRERFSGGITRALEAEPGITIVREEVRDVPPDGVVVVASGPLTSAALSDGLQRLLGRDFLFFHDAISPVIETDSIDPAVTFKASRYNKGTADYINCPLTRDEYYGFIDELLRAEKMPLRDFETLTPFEGCMPIEVMAGRGPETLAFGPMKPVGLVDPRSGRRPHAVVQLRQENREATLYNMVGFQTRLKWPEQKRIFCMLPGLESAVFARYGSLHRNTFVQSPLLLLRTLQLQRDPRLFFAGQITGVEGYIESAATGLLAGILAARFVQGADPVTPPPETVLGSLLSHLTDRTTADFQPMNATFGLLPPPGKKVRKRERKQLLAGRALEAVQHWCDAVGAGASVSPNM